MGPRVRGDDTGGVVGGVFITMGVVGSVALVAPITTPS